MSYFEPRVGSADILFKIAISQSPLRKRVITRQVRLHEKDLIVEAGETKLPQSQLQNNRKSEDVKEVISEGKSSNAIRHNPASFSLNALSSFFKLLVMFIFVGKASADSLISISAPTASGNPNAIVEGVEMEPRYHTFTDGHKFHGYLEVENGTHFRLFSPQGQQLASINNISAQYKISLQFLEPLQVLCATYKPNIWYRYTIQDNSGVISMSLAYTGTLSGFTSTATYIDPTSGYLYFAGSQDFKKVLRVRELSNMTSRTTMPDNPTNMGWGRSVNPMLPSDLYLLVGGDFNTHLVVTKVNMTLFGSVSNTINGVTSFALHTRLNNLNSDEFFMGTKDNFVRKLTLDQSAMTFTETATSLSYTNVGTSGLLNMGTLQYMVLSSGNSIDFLYKPTNLIKNRVFFTDGIATEGNSLTGFEFDSKGMFFGRIEGTNKNFQSYYLVFDNCTYRTATGVCLDCKSGYYRNTTAAGGDCILPADFPPQNGIDYSNVLMVPCQDTHCLDCVTNYAQCQSCKVIDGYFVHTDTKCYSVASMPAGFGADAATGTSKPCLSGCLQCAANYQICTQCNLASGYYLHLIDNKCYTTSTMPPGYGANSGTGQTAQCQDVHCTSCPNTYTTCTVCDTFNGYYLHLADTHCYNAATIIAGYGIDTSSGQTALCQDANCKLCPNSYTVCTECKTALGYFLHSLDSKCYNSPNMPVGYGPNTGTGTTYACQDPNCLDCATTYTYCAQCKTASGFYLHSDAKCYNSASMPNGFGPNTGTGQTATCQDTHCLLCASLYTACTQCNTGAGWYLHSDTKCYNVATMPTGFGVKSATGTTSVCQTGNCQLCASVYTTCTQCLASFYLHSDNLCYSVATMPSGYGATGTGTTHACNEPNCVLCKADYMTCTSCNTGSGYYLHTDAKCYNVPSMPTGFGANTVTGLVASCSASQCQVCSANYSACTTCNSNYYVHLDGNCYDVPGMPSGYGRNIANGSTTSCQTTSCELCASAYTTCTKCLTSFYLHSDNKCYSVATMPNGYGPTSSGTTTSCLVSNCMICSADPNICTGCDTSDGYFVHSNNRCYDLSNMPQGFGGNNLTGKTESCQVTNCLLCPSNPLACTECATGYYVHTDAKCYSPAALPSGFGPSTGGSTVACASLGCIVCKLDYKVCSQCDTGYELLANGTCKSHCGLSNCFRCSEDYLTCTECDTANGYILVNGTCVFARELLFTVTLSSITMPHSDVVFVLTSSSISQGMVILARYAMQPSVALSPQSNAQANQSLESTAIRLTYSGTQLIMSLSVYNTSFGDGKPWMLTASCKNTNLLVNSTLYVIKCTQNTSIYMSNSTKQGIDAAEKKAAVVSGLTSTMSSTDSAVGMSLMGTLLAADPTGTFFRFTKILQIVNKLYFININYGKRLEAFLAKSALRYKKLGNDVIYGQHWRGKLDEKDVPLRAVPHMSYRVVLYLISWILKGVKRLLLDNCIMGKIGIYFCHYANRAHLIIFNLVFIDFIWLAPRTLMHARVVTLIEYNSTILVMCLIAADLCLILSHLLDDRIWRKALEHYTSLRESTTHIPLPKSKQTVRRYSRQVLPSITTTATTAMTMNEPGSAPKQDDPNQDQTKQINYKKTYFEIDFNVHLMDMATNTLRVDESVFQSTLCRLLAVQWWLRVSYITLAILSCQYANTLGLTVLLIIELSRLFATIYAYLKYKYLKNIICLLMEVSQSFFLMLFFLNALLISPKRFDELIMDFYQDAGIWIVIASCVAEYLLLLTYIGVATYDFFKNRKMMKRINFRRYQVIKYKQRGYQSAKMVPYHSPLVSRSSPKLAKLKEGKIVSTRGSEVLKGPPLIKGTSNRRLLCSERDIRLSKKAPHQNVEASSGQTGS